MTDDTHKRHLDKLQIDVGEDYELRDNAEKYNISKDELRAIVTKVGPWRTHIEAELRRLGKWG